MNGPSDEQHAFGSILLDRSRGRVFRAGEEVALRPKCLALFAHLAQHAGRVVSKEELIGTLWPDVFVTEDSLTRCVHEVREALGPAGAGLIRTIPRRGYMLDPGQPVAAAAAPARPDETAPPLRRDGIAVLPFALAHGELPGDGALVAAIAHEVQSRLVRMRGFHVIARASTQALRHAAADPQAAGRRLGVAHVVAGTATIRGGQVRLLIDIVGAEDGGILWAGEFGAARQDYAGLVGAMTDRIAQEVHRQITTAEVRRALALPTEALDAWGHFHAGLSDVYSSDPARLGAALGHFRAATARAPRFARAYAGQSVCHWVMAFSGMTADRGAEAGAALRTAETAVALDETDPYTIWCWGRARALEGGMADWRLYSERAITLCPSFSYGHFELGHVESMHGDPERSLRHLDIFLSLSPMDPTLRSVQITQAHAAYRLGRLEDAARWARSAAGGQDNFVTILAPAALILAAAGETAAAEAIAARIRTLSPDRGTGTLDRSVAAMSPDLAQLFVRHGGALGL